MIRVAPDVLGYAGKRVIVTGAASGAGAAVTGILVELGAEVHTVDSRKPDSAGIASFTEADARDGEQLARAVDKIGSVVNAFFHCEDRASEADVFAMAATLTDKMVDGSAIALLAPTDHALDLTALADDLWSRGMRINAVHVGAATASATAEQCAWPLLFLNSPRSSALTGMTLVACGRVGAPHQAPEMGL